MNIQDNVLKHYLQKVYFFLGPPCGGKSTTARALGKRLGLPVYGADERFSRHLKASDPRFQPVMNKRFQNADEFFGRSVAEYEGWLRQNAREDSRHGAGKNKGCILGTGKEPGAFEEGKAWTGFCSGEAGCETDQEIAGCRG